MRIKLFSSRNLKELVLDPTCIIFGIGLPVFLLVLIQVINQSISSEAEIAIFDIQNFAPGIAVFSFSFISLFAGILVSKDRCSSFLTRLFASPMTSVDFILGYSLPLLPMALVQAVVCFGTALFFGLKVSINLLPALLLLIPSAILFIASGLLLGSVLSDKQVGAVSSILVQVAALSSGMWFPLEQIGGALKTICYLLPFAHGVAMVQDAVNGDFSGMPVHLIWVLGYTIAVFAAAIYIFRRKMTN